MTVSQDGQQQRPGTEPPKWNAAFINVINSTCLFPAMRCQNVSSGEDSVIRGETNDAKTYENSIQVLINRNNYPFKQDWIWLVLFPWNNTNQSDTFSSGSAADSISQLSNGRFAF